MSKQSSPTVAKMGSLLCMAMPWTELWWPATWSSDFGFLPLPSGRSTTNTWAKPVPTTTWLSSWGCSSRSTTPVKPEARCDSKPDSISCCLCCFRTGGFLTNPLLPMFAAVDDVGKAFSTSLMAPDLLPTSCGLTGRNSLHISYLPLSKRHRFTRPSPPPVKRWPLACTRALQGLASWCAWNAWAILKSRHTNTRPSDTPVQTASSRGTKATQCVAAGALCGR
mmetsp:Transcript_16890/g.48149  ORF Transcript_16890/g.48149 Transcript_16890/m.48149 type:complete len:223 (-) Transcript_16890:1879-2547(-)